VIPEENKDGPKESELRKAMFSNFKQRRFVTKFMIFWVVLFGLINLLAYSLEPCTLNTYDTGEGVCNDCLGDLGITCQECTSKT